MALALASWLSAPQRGCPTPFGSVRQAASVESVFGSQGRVWCLDCVVRADKDGVTIMFDLAFVFGEG